MALDNESFDILLSTVQRFVRERLIPAENHLEEHDEVPPELVEAMKEMGLFGLTVPEEFGGIGLSVSQEVQVNFELGRTAPAFRSVFGTNIGIGSQGILMDGTPDQKAARATSMSTRWSASTATSGCSASMKAPRRSSKSSSAAS